MAGCISHNSKAANLQHDVVVGELNYGERELGSNTTHL